MTTYRVIVCKYTAPTPTPTAQQGKSKTSKPSSSPRGTIKLGGGELGGGYRSPSRFLGNKPDKHQKPLASTNVLEDGYKSWVG